MFYICVMTEEDECSKYISVFEIIEIMNLYIFWPKGENCFKLSVLLPDL